MNPANTVDLARSTPSLPLWLRETAFGFFFWVLFLLALEPGNVLHARHMGYALSFEREALRISVAALLGASVTPLVLALTRRYPLPGPNAWRNALIHVTSATALALALIVVSCFLASWILMGQALPSMADVQSQLAANWMLLVFALCAFTAIVHAVQRFPRKIHQAGPPNRIAVKTRGRLGYVDVDSIEWIESQGNYLALHVGGHAHLIRETLARFATRLDAQRFTRIHRRVIVAVDRIREIQPLSNGDSALILRDGRELRASRSHREVIRQRWTEFMTREAASARDKH